MKVGFTTLGTPDWDLGTIICRATEYGFDGVDFRGIGDEIDVTILREFTEDLGETAASIRGAGLQAGISTSLRICDASMLADNLAEAERTIPVAKALGMGVVRVFGGGDSKDNTKEDMAEVGGETMASVLQLEGANELEWVLETHDEWISSADCKLVLDRVPAENFGILWDIGHTSRVEDESPRISWDRIGERVKHLHIKDAVYDITHPDAMADGWRYVAPGKGELPLSEAVDLVQTKGYESWIIFEHEKRWHRELPEPEEALPEFMRWIQGVIN
jgi:sugar phosphate isomerase/epimerase